MIELRWLEKSEPFKHDPNIAQEVRVLQYRQMIPYAAANGNLMLPLEPNWSDWQDVPVARGDYPAGSQADADGTS